MLRAREACVADIALQDCQWLVYLLMDGSEDTRVRNTYGVVRTVLFLTMCVGWTVPTGMLGCISVRKQSWFLDVVSNGRPFRFVAATQTEVWRGHDAKTRQRRIS